jgi:hypothetical protein
MKPLTLTTCLVLALVAAPPVSSAQPSDPKAAAADARGRTHFQRGQRLSASGDYAGAYREFAAGYALTSRPLFLFNMGEAARASGDAAKAREAYLEFLRVDPTSSLAATAQARLAELDRTSPPPAVTTAPPPKWEPIPLLPPSATQPPSTSPQALPPERFVGVERHAEEHRPIWKRWPFWAVVGGVVAGGAIVFAVSRDAGDPCGAGCAQLNFR